MNLSHTSDYKNDYYAANKERLLARGAEYKRERIATDPVFKFRNTFTSSVRNGILTHLAGGNNRRKDWENSPLGCTIPEYKKYLESNFHPGMSWDNFNRYGWHIDHIIPLASAPTIEQLHKLLHYTNTRPMWAIENLGRNRLFYNKRKKNNK